MEEDQTLNIGVMSSNPPIDFNNNVLFPGDSLMEVDSGVLSNRLSITYDRFMNLNIGVNTRYCKKEGTTYYWFLLIIYLASFEFGSFILLPQPWVEKL